MEKIREKVIIVGGGMLGLSLAYYLSKQGREIEIYEMGNDWGGLASTTKIQNFAIEKYYHHWFKSDIHIQDLIKELGLQGRLVWLPSSMGIFHDNEILPFSTSLDLIKFKKLNLLERIRVGVVSLYLQKSKYDNKLQKQTALDWCYRFFGRKATDILFKPLFKGKFGKKAETISMSWFWSRMHDRSSSRPNPITKEYLGYMQGGFQPLIDKLVEVNKNNGVKFFAEQKLIGHNYSDGLHKLRFVDKHGAEIQSEAKDVISTVPGPIFTKIFDVEQSVKNKISRVKYLGATCMIMVLKKSISPYYWMNINDASFPFMALIEHTNLVDKSKYANKHIIYLAKYIDPNEELFQKSEEELYNLYLKYLAKVNPDFDKSWVEEKILFKSAFAQHIVDTGYQIPDYETNLSGLYYVNFSQIFPHDRGTNYAVEQAKQITKLITKNSN